LISFLERQLEPHILCDREYRILAANRAYRAQTGVTGDVIGHKCHEVSHHYALPCDQVGETCPLTRSLESGMREHVMHLHHTPTGRSYENIELTPLRDATGAVGFFIEKLEHLSLHKASGHGNALVGASPPFMRLMELVARVAPSDASVLLQGESGTGKELVAQALHDASARAMRPFVVVDCSGLPETLFESEFFGHERGAFTGASTRQQGLIEAASGGTLFLGRGGRHPAEHPGQAAAAARDRHLPSCRRHGTAPGRRARGVGDTHRCLRDRVAEGAFRQDLFYRLSTFPIPIPALRERRADLPALIEALMQRFTKHRRYTFTPAALWLLQTYDYPGNVRELRNVLERASLMCDGDVIGVEHLPPELQAPLDRAGAAPAPTNPAGAAPAIHGLEGHRAARSARADRPAPRNASRACSAARRERAHAVPDGSSAPGLRSGVHPQSARRHSIGSIFDARRAGYQPKNRPMAVEKPTAVSTWLAPSAISNLPVLLTAMAPPQASATPTRPPTMHITTASLRNCASTCQGLAPMAMRMPISRTRSLTLTSMMFMMPMPPTSSEMAPITPRPTDSPAPMLAPVSAMLARLTTWKSSSLSPVMRWRSRSSSAMSTSAPASATSSGRAR
jgi:two-component system response regulator HydG